MNIKTELEKRILVLDGAMGTMIQKYRLGETDYRGSRFADWQTPLKGNNDLLVLTQPQVIAEIHRQYLEAGADIIETCTFNSQRISMEDYAMGDLVREINLAAAQLARALADEFSTPDKPRFVAGSVGPTGKSASMSPDMNNLAFRSVTFDELAAAYQEQMEALITGGVDALLIETIFDTLNAKAAIFAAEKAMQAVGRRVELMLSATVADTSGRTLSGQTIQAFITSVSHANALSIGLNCSFGAHELKPYLKELSQNTPLYVSAHPNAGFPNQFGEYDQTPEKMAVQIREYIDEGLVNIIGGCCGTSPAHIAQYAGLIAGKPPRQLPKPTTDLQLAGLDNFRVAERSDAVSLSNCRSINTQLTNIGERCNVAGSKKFLRLIKEKNYEEALRIARQQVEDGAQIIDINMDDAMLDARQEMVTFLNLIASEPEIARTPLMIDSSKWDVIEAALQCVQGKSVVNSISLKEGEDAFLDKARKIRAYGAAAVVMAFDERGQADTRERKIEICTRAYRLLTEQLNFPPQDIIFDPNVLAIGTGIEEHNNYAVDFIEATRRIKQNLPCAKVSGGISNLSFSFRGNNELREAIHSVFLYHAQQAGLDMGIVNPASLQGYDSIDTDWRELIEDLVLNRRPDATERLIKNEELRMKNDASTSLSNRSLSEVEAWREEPLENRLEYALVKGIEQYLAEDLAEALAVYSSALEIVEKPLMNGMTQVGELFGEGKMFLPQVVKTARTMKKAVDILQPHIEAQQQQGEHNSAGRFLIATVKGDVHDIGKNIVSVILACNNYEVIDLGVMVPTETIVETAVREQVDVVGLSGLITPSLEEMCRVAEQMEQAGLHTPLFIGGATTSAIHTAVKIAPAYSGAVVHAKDASQNVSLVARLLNPDTRASFLAELEAKHRSLQQQVATRETRIVDWEQAKEKRLKLF